MYICIISVYVFAFVSTLDIFDPNQVAKGVLHLQAALGLPQTGVEGEQERRLIKEGKCVNSSNQEPGVSPEFRVAFPESPSVEIFKTSEDNSVNFEEVPPRKPDVTLPGKSGNGRSFCKEGRLVRKCSKKTNQCSWFCRKKKNARQWS